jgi:hypothetical protein
MVRILHLPKKSFFVERGKHYDLNYFTRIIDKDTDCFVDGTLIFSFRKRVVKNDEWLPLMKLYLSVPELKSDRRMIAGAAKSKRILINSGIIGYYDRLTPQMKLLLKANKAGRASAFTSNYPREWKDLTPLFQELDLWYKKTSPSFYAIQKKECKRVEKDLLIGSTVFSTVTVNKDWRTATHKDSGNFTKALSCILVLGENIKGGFLGFPEYKICVSLEPGDAILMKADEYHCNTELEIGEGGCRYSLVCYLREDMSLFHKKVVKKGHIYYL